MSVALNTKHLSSFISEEEYAAIYPQVEAAHKQLEAKNGPGSDFLGWMTLPRDYDKEEFARIMFETIVDVKKPAQDLFIDPLEGNFDGLNFLANQNMSVVNRKAMEGTILAHTDGGVPEVLIEVDDLSAYNVGYLIYFFWRACACSGYLLSVNPFNQPGVESYKKNMFALLGKPGYEGLTAELEAKLK